MADIARFLHKLQVDYDLPHHLDDATKAERLADITKRLQEEDEDVQVRTIKIFAEHYRRRTLPTLRDVIDVIQVAREEIRLERFNARIQASKPVPETNEDIADRLLRSELGQQAAREGWVSTFYDFAMKNGRIPAPNEIEDLKLRGRQIAREMEQADARVRDAFHRRRRNITRAALAVGKAQA